MVRTANPRRDPRPRMPRWFWIAWAAALCAVFCGFELTRHVVFLPDDIVYRLNDIASITTFYAWLIALSLGWVFFRRRYARLGGELQFAIGIMAVVVAMSDPYWGLTSGNVTSASGVNITMMTLIVIASIARLVFVRTCFETVEPLCVRCYYDVTGNTTGHCPECGEAIPNRIFDKVVALRSKKRVAGSRTHDSAPH